MDNQNKSCSVEDQPAVKPCCVCKDEKAQRDECFLLKGPESPDCQSILGKYKECMAGFGFKI
ncbi:copper metallochaperone [Starmerella bacillaris]|uniref:Copper metallochaperone n=1 Tax=Starmerella bacillaris TaxID=1247836 RepID=A0AAV5RIP8_STABA|nr:copper metallochaperone [Starmerella bacillaris]